LTSEFEFDLPRELIAQAPAKERTGSRLMVLERKSGTIQNIGFATIVNVLREGDVLVLNDTKVLAARLQAVSAKGKKVEILLLEKIRGRAWNCLAGPGRNANPGD